MKKGQKMSIESRKKISESRVGRFKGKDNPKWRGGRTMRDGYCYIYAPDHPNKTKSGCVVEHRLVMEKKLGRYLEKHELVHHINHNRLDNRPENLMLTNNSEHMSHHPEIFEKQKTDFKGKHFSPKTEFKKGHNRQ